MTEEPKEEHVCKKIPGVHLTEEEREAIKKSIRDQYGKQEVSKGLQQQVELEVGHLLSAVMSTVIDQMYICSTVMHKEMTLKYKTHAEQVYPAKAIGEILKTPEDFKKSELDPVEYRAIEKLNRSDGVNKTESSDHSCSPKDFPVKTTQWSEGIKASQEIEKVFNEIEQDNISGVKIPIPIEWAGRIYDLLNFLHTNDYVPLSHTRECIKAEKILLKALETPVGERIYPPIATD